MTNKIEQMDLWGIFALGAEEAATTETKEAEVENKESKEISTENIETPEGSVQVETKQESVSEEANNSVTEQEVIQPQEEVVLEKTVQNEIQSQEVSTSVEETLVSEIQPVAAIPSPEVERVTEAKETSIEIPEKKTEAVQEVIEPQKDIEVLSEKVRESAEETNGTEENTENKEVKEDTEQKKKEASKPAAAKKADEGDEFAVTVNTKIIVGTETYDALDLFTLEEIQVGFPKTEKGETVYKPITQEDLRKKIVKEHPSFVKSLAKFLYTKKSDEVICWTQAGKKGSTQENEMESPSDDGGFAFKIPFSLLKDFIAVAKQYSDHFEVEVHADIYMDKDGKFLLDFPRQDVHKFWAEVCETEMEAALKHRKLMANKIAEIHSHNTMAPYPSPQDDESEVAPGVLYAIVGNLNSFMPDITARYYDEENEQHVRIDPYDVFESPFDYIPTQYNLSLINIVFGTEEDEGNEE